MSSIAKKLKLSKWQKDSRYNEELNAIVIDFSDELMQKEKVELNKLGIHVCTMNKKPRGISVRHNLT
jgi:hypothetical protein